MSVSCTAYRVILGIVLTQVCIIGLKFFLEDIFFATLWARAFPPPQARALNLICQAHRSQVLTQPNNIRRKNSYKLESTQTKFSVRTCNFVFKIKVRWNRFGKKLLMTLTGLILSGIWRALSQTLLQRMWELKNSLKTELSTRPRSHSWQGLLHPAFLLLWNIY